MNTNEQTTPLVALVTGSNRGIGFEVCRQLAKAHMTVILAARDLAKARDAAQVLAAEGLDVRPQTLNITQDESVRSLATMLDQEFGRLDVLVNNAATYPDMSETAINADMNVVRAIFDSNVLGAWRIIQAMLPLIHKSKHGRIINVSSGAGSHGDLQFGLTASRGSVASYAVSKAALNALTTALASELEGSRILINAVCPSFTATSPGMEAMGARPVQEGAASVVWAAMLPDDGPSGGFFRDGKPLPW